MKTYLAWIRECSGYVDGWVGYEIKASSYEEALDLAHERFAGTQGYHTLAVDLYPVEERVSA